MKGWGCFDVFWTKCKGSQRTHRLRENIYNKWDGVHQPPIKANKYNYILKEGQKNDNFNLRKYILHKKIKQNTELRLYFSTHCLR